MTADLSPYLLPGKCVDSDHPRVLELAQSLTENCQSEKEKAIALYYYVRDAIRYNPYTVSESYKDFRATAVMEAGEAWCVPKAVMLAALCRSIGIPARLGYADVVNHLSTQRMRDSMDTDVFYFHGYCSIYIDGKWVKSTPAFNLSLCEKMGLLPLEFDGENDSLYHEFDQAGNRHMEYIHERGEYEDVPLEEMMSIFAQHYPSMMSGSSSLHDSTLWEEDVANETPG